MITIIIIIGLAIVGFGTSLYAFYLEQTLKKDAQYKPFCSINDRFDCTKPLTSSYNALLGISNALVGLVFYSLVIVCELLHLPLLVLALAIGAAIVSLWLAYIVYFKIKTICLVCTTIYIVNIGLLLMSIIQATRG